MNISEMSLEDRIVRLEDIESIKQLKATYAQYCDDGYNPEGIASLFVEDGLWLIKGVGGEAKGREGIKKHFRNLKTGVAWAQHYILSPLVNIAPDGKRAEATFYLYCLVTMKASPNSSDQEAVMLAGKYSDKFVKIDGQWYFEEMTGTIDQSSPWIEGWVKSPFVKESW